MLLTRREWTVAVGGALLAAPLARLGAQSRSVVAGVRIGAQTYVFRSLPLDQVPGALKAAGLSFAELWSGHVETGPAIGVPQGISGDARRELRTWRTKGPLSAFEAVRTKFADAGVTLDIGHFTAANFDGVTFLDEHHDRIHALHIKDRKRDQGAGVPFGQGDAPIAAVLHRLRDRKWDIPAHIEFDYRPADVVAEVTTCYDYGRKALEAR